MSKIVFLGDTHKGARDDSTIVLEYQLKFFEKVLFPYMKKNKLDTIVQVGDSFDRRKMTNHVTLSKWKERVYDYMRDNQITYYTLIGNHDAFFKNTLSVNSPEKLLNEYENITVFSKPQEVEIKGSNFLIIPWICDDNYQEIMSAVEKSKSHYCVGHFEFSGFEMNKGYTVEEGMSTDNFKKFEKVISGHYHTSSNDGHVYYLGTPYELTWIDYNDPKSFYIFDTELGDWSDIVKNPYSLFHKIEWNDGINDNLKTDSLRDCYVKVIVTNKGDPSKFDTFIKKLGEVGLADLKIIDTVEVESIELSEEVNIEDTQTLIKTYCETLGPEILEKMNGLYVEALAIVE